MSRMIGAVKANGKEFNINQAQHAQPNGEYEVQDMEKRAEIDAEIEKEKSENK